MTAKIIENRDYRNRIAVFADRFQAGKLLASKLQEYSGKENVTVLAVPAGGVPVGQMVARELCAPMDVVIVRKIQIPWNPEAGFGAITWDGKIVLNEGLIGQLAYQKKKLKRQSSRQNLTFKKGLVSSGETNQCQTLPARLSFLLMTV
jgi:putative phosphoribosyl transferase